MNIPNMISLLRLFLAPLIVWLLLSYNYFNALIIFCIAGISDILDGMLARKMNCDTQLGRYLDPIADKILLTAVFITMGLQELIPSWVVIIAVFRDILIIGGAVLLLLFDSNVKEIKPLLVSKINTFIQITVVIVVLFQISFGVNFSTINDYLFMFSAFFTVLSCITYVIRWCQGNLLNNNK